MKKKWWKKQAKSMYKTLKLIEQNVGNVVLCPKVLADFEAKVKVKQLTEEETVH